MNRGQGSFQSTGSPPSSSRITPATGVHPSHSSMDALSTVTDSATGSGASLLPSLPMVLTHVLAAVVAARREPSGVHAITSPLSGPRSRRWTIVSSTRASAARRTIGPDA